MRAVNLIPSDQRRSGVSVGVGAGHSGGAAYAVLGLVLAIAVLAFLYGHAKHQVSSRNGEVSSLQARAQMLQSEVSTLSPYTSFVQLREARTQAVASLVDSRFDWAHAFHEFGRVLPRNIAISSLDGTVGSSTASVSPTPSASGASTVASATPPGSVPTFTLAGCATSQRAVATMLQRLRLIDGASEVTLQSSAKAGAGSAGGAGGCEGGQPAFTATVAFQALPSTSEAAVAATGKSATVSSSTPSSASTPATGGAQ